MDASAGGREVQCRRCENRCRLFVEHEGGRIVDVLKVVGRSGSSVAAARIRPSCGRAVALVGSSIEGIEERVALGARDGRLPLGFSIGVH